MERFRTESDLIGEKQVPGNAYYGIQTLRAMENFDISGVKVSAFPKYIESLALVKLAAAKANHELGDISDEMIKAIERAAEDVSAGLFNDQFPIDLIQGGAGTSTNMNINEVIANRTLEILGKKKGEYEFCHPNDHINMSQSTNDVFPTAIKIALIKMNVDLEEALAQLVEAFRKKGEEFSHVIKMGRTQLQDAVPMTVGQEFEAFAATLSEETARLEQNAALFEEINMGATAIGTGINTDPNYTDKVVKHLSDLTGIKLKRAKNFIEATPDTGAFVMYSSVLKRLAVKLSKICNDLRLLSSGPRTGLNEINLPPMQPGSSIMPGKVNPVIPEVVNQVCFVVFGNDTTITFAAEAGQLQLNVMEPVLVRSLFESMDMLQKAMDTLRELCIDGITVNEEHCKAMVLNSIGIVTALNPVLGYKVCSALAKEALRENRSVYDLVLEKKLLEKEDLDDILSPENMVQPRRFKQNNKK
ncbi:aspartate ammonia-lyase [Sediminitomix flava]|nr:aspartate ammonia-lyase [Sediminitomix flava]